MNRNAFPHFVTISSAKICVCVNLVGARIQAKHSTMSIVYLFLCIQYVAFIVLKSWLALESVLTICIKCGSKENEQGKTKRYNKSNMVSLFIIADEELNAYETSCLIQPGGLLYRLVKKISESLDVAISL